MKKERSIFQSVAQFIRAIPIYLEYECSPHGKTKNGNPPLISAAMGNNVKGVKRLIDLKVDFEATDLNGQTALYLTTAFNQPQIVKLLLEAGANPNAQDPESGYSALHRAVMPDMNNNARDPEIARMLLEADADTEIKNEYGGTPLYDAAYARNIEFVKMLLKYKADPNAIDKDGYSILHRTAYQGDAEMVKVLLEAEADHTVTIKHNSLTEYLEGIDDYTPVKAASFGMEKCEKKDRAKYLQIIDMLNEASGQKNLSEGASTKETLPEGTRIPTYKINASNRTAEVLRNAVPINKLPI